MFIKIGSFVFEKKGGTFIKFGKFEMYLTRSDLFDKWPVVIREKGQQTEVWFRGRHLIFG
jgi:hypothetical protein